ncbi:hypothetical protein HPC49_42240 [Pyxidicoccus fallax]|uniref:Uncharacterized protein n=1 Tax=Pyxidicoccus fallax TaxID=394095 RepID=A0A848LWS9_9BACT|nr:hypothetical protein [Pyxidicoccus fallax]NMO21734.1 hypothetical protein [Pyxidicoccus fallax]NPC84826.1 hypothetical protein [Pyxidicoccus fallax]
MTSGRFVSLGGTVLMAVLTFTAPLGCGDGTTPCTDCPPLEGRYRLDFADAGVSGECTQLGVALPQGKRLDITREEATLTGSVEGVPLRGTVSSLGTFNLGGASAGSPDGGVTQVLNMTGRFTPPVEDGGTARLAGTYTGNFTRAGPNGPQRCNVVNPFSATRE